MSKTLREMLPLPFSDKIFGEKRVVDKTFVEKGDKNWEGAVTRNFSTLFYVKVHLTVFL